MPFAAANDVIDWMIANDVKASVYAIIAICDVLCGFSMHWKNVVIWRLIFSFFFLLPFLFEPNWKWVENEWFCIESLTVQIICDDAFVSIRKLYICLIATACERTEGGRFHFPISKRMIVYLLLFYVVQLLLRVLPPGNATTKKGKFFTLFPVFDTEFMPIKMNCNEMVRIC